MKDEVPLEEWPLKYWQSEDWENVRCKLDFLEDNGIPYNPARVDLFRALRLCSRTDTKVAIIGQDPYPNPDYATGVAFSSCKYGRQDQDGEIISKSIPASLRTIFREYVRDLQYSYPSTGCLEKWASQGVLLWNATPTIEIENTDEGWKAHTHSFWPEWPPLTEEIVRKVSDQGEAVFVFFGKRAQEYSKFVNTDNGVNTVLHHTHPSPLARVSSIPGSRLFNTINDALQHHGKEPIDWRLD